MSPDLRDERRISRAARTTVLVVEKEVVLRCGIAEYLRDCGYRVIEAANADEALAVLQHRDMRVEVLFTDTDVSGSMNGFALAQKVRAEWGDVKVVLTDTLAAAVNAAGELCEDGPIPKPYEPQIVLDRIRRLLAKTASSMI